MKDHLNKKPSQNQSSIGKYDYRFKKRENKKWDMIKSCPITISIEKTNNPDSDTFLQDSTKILSKEWENNNP